MQLAAATMVRLARPARPWRPARMPAA